MTAPNTSAGILATLQFGTFPSRKAFERYVRKQIRARGFKAIKARYDKGGNCRTCGECGRCPGWHTEHEKEQAPQTISHEK